MRFQPLCPSPYFSPSLSVCVCLMLLQWVVSWSYCVAVLSQSQWVCQSSSGWKTLSFLASCSNCLPRGLFCPVPGPLPPRACVSLCSSWQANTKAMDSFYDPHLQTSCSPPAPPSILWLIYSTSICLSLLMLRIFSCNVRLLCKSRLV